MGSATSMEMRLRCGGGLPFALFYIAVVALAGCSRKEPVVTVRFDAIPRVASPAPDPEPLAQVQASALVARSASIEALPARRLFLGGNAARLDSALEALELNRQRAFQRVLQRLEQTLVFDVEQTARQLRSDLADERRRSLDQAYAELRSVFEVHAALKGRLPWELAALVGFPDPDPNSTRPLTFARSDRLNPRRVKAKTYRERIAEIDAQYVAARDRLLSRVADASREEAEAIERRIDAMLADARNRAAAEAQRLAASRGHGTLDARNAARDERLEEQPAASVTVSAVPPVPVPKLQSPRMNVIDSEAWNRALLVLWARSHGYRIARTGERARDATEEFSRWRATYLLGP